jgi:ubiquinone/menaquinone biosynthesis C-methylase UbiE
MSLYLAGGGLISLSGLLYLQYRSYKEDSLKTKFLEHPDRSKFFFQTHESIAETYDYEMKDYEWAKRIDKYRKVLCSYAEGRVLEVGIGTGLNFGFYPQSTALTGVDWSEKMLQKSKENLQGKAKLVQMDAKDLKFEDESFDCVVSTFVLSSSDQPDKVLSEAARVCKKGGKVLVLDRGKGDDWLTNFFLKLYRYEYLFKLGYDQFSDIEKVVKRAGLKVQVEERKQGNSIYFYILSKDM